MDIGGIDMVKAMTPESPEDIVRQLQELKQKARDWKKDYASWAVPGDPSYMFLYNDLLAEIEESLIPYVQRMVDCGIITLEQRSEVLAFVYDQALELRLMIEGKDDTDPWEAWIKGRDQKT